MGPMAARDARARGSIAASAAVVALLLLAAAPARADDAPPVTTPGTATAAQPAVTPGESQTAAPPAAAPPVATTSTSPRRIPWGIRIAGHAVGGLTRPQAIAAVTARFERPLRLQVSAGIVRSASPAELGAQAQVALAVGAALEMVPPFDVPLFVEIDDAALAGYVDRLRAATARGPRDSRLVVRDTMPYATPSLTGRSLRVAETRRALRRSLLDHDRRVFEVPFRTSPPVVTERDHGYSVIVFRESRLLVLYSGGSLVRTFMVATGVPEYPTPLGRFAIVVKERDPWWHPPPDSAWAKGKPPVPPGPGNPLGTRWMGINAPYVGIHGTPDAASIGYSASHGCIRMLIDEVEWLFDRITVGTPVFILSV